MKKISEKIEKLINYMLIILMSVLAISTILQVLSRFILKAPIIWTEEVTRTAFIWIALLGSTLATKYDKHLALDFLSNKVPESILYYIRLLVHAIMIIVSFIFIFGGWSFIQKNISRVSITTGMPMYYTYFSLPFAGVITLFFLIEKLPRLLSKRV